MITRTFSLITCGFPHGAYQSQNINQPEVRIPSIRGHLRWWYDALFPTNGLGHHSRPSDAIFGNIGKEAVAGKVIVRLEVLHENIDTKQSFIPHKGRKGGDKNAIAPGSNYRLIITQRRGGISEKEQQKLTQAVDAWLLLGSIGQRANRGGGSLMPEDPPTSNEGFYSRADNLLKDSKIKVAILDDTFDSEFDLRDVAGDFLADKAFLNDQTPFGSARPRKPSLLKLKGVRIAGDLKLLALWDGRYQRPGTLSSAVNKLADSKDIGYLLQSGLDRLTS